MEFYHKLNEIMTYDAGGRGLRTPMPDLAAVAEELCGAERVLVLTGFPVFGEDGIARGETDGPIGASEIACTLAQLGSQVWLATDEASYDQLCAAIKVFGEETGVKVFSLEEEAQPRTGSFVQVLKVPSENTEQYAEEIFEKYAFTHFVPIERPGKGLCGHFCSMRGRILDEYVADTDYLLALFKGVSIGIGDGGNELGMGKYQDLIIQQVNHGEKIAAKLAADHVLTAGVSNWWGPGLAALLSRKTGRDLLAGPATEERVLRAVVAAGGLDGCTGKPTISVDGLDLAVHLERRALVRKLLDESKVQDCVPV